MIFLPNVTLFAVDTIHPQWALKAMQFSMAHVRFADAVLLTDARRHRIGASRVRVVHHTESNHSVDLGYRKLFPDYESAYLFEPSERIKNGINTSHVLCMEWDAAVLNAWAWDPAWLKYDYIGAPWDAHCDFSGVPCDGHTNNVGNAGFSLRSSAFNEAVRHAYTHFKDDPLIRAGKLSADIHPCIVWRPWLEKEHGVKFAPEDVARKFSCECRIYAGEFGAHGKETWHLNGWKGFFLHVTEAK